MASTEEWFRRLTIGDPSLMAALARGDGSPSSAPHLDGRTRWLLEIAALVALDAPPSSYRAAVDAAQRAGVRLADLLETLVAIAGTVGSARVVSAAPRIALAAGYDVEAALEGLDPPSPSEPPPPTGADLGPDLGIQAGAR